MRRCRCRLAPLSASHICENTRRAARALVIVTLPIRKEHDSDTQRSALLSTFAMRSIVPPWRKSSRCRASDELATFYFGACAGGVW